MTWKEVVETVGFRKEIVTLASQPGANIRELCRRFKVSAKTMYKWIGRYRAQGEAGLENRSRRPHRSPGRMGAALERKGLIGNNVVNFLNTAVAALLGWLLLVIDPI